MKPVSQYKVIGTSYPMPGIPDKVTGQDAMELRCQRCPGCCTRAWCGRQRWARRLISVGELDKKRVPDRRRWCRKGNLVAVVSPNEWEAVSAARSVAAATKWTDWSGLPGSENLTQATARAPVGRAR